MEIKKILTADEESRQISALANNMGEQALLYRRINTGSQDTDLKALSERQDVIRNQKFSVSEFLENEQNYSAWKANPKNNALLLYKLFSQGYLTSEIKDSSSLAQKLHNDFKLAFEQADPLTYQTSVEKNLEQHYINNSVKVENRPTYEKENQQVKALHNEQACFEKNYHQMVNDLSNISKPSPLIKKVLEQVKANRLLLADNPNHKTINPKQSDFQTVRTDQLESLIQQANLQEASSIAALNQLSGTYEELGKKKSIVANIKDTRVALQPDKYTHVDKVKPK
jgi:hypothetical protein